MKAFEGQKDLPYFFNKKKRFKETYQWHHRLNRQFIYRKHSVPTKSGENFDKTIFFWNKTKKLNGSPFLIMYWFDRKTTHLHFCFVEVLFVFCYQLWPILLHKNTHLTSINAIYINSFLKKCRYILIFFFVLFLYFFLAKQKFFCSFRNSNFSIKLNCIFCSSKLNFIDLIFICILS